MKKADPWFTIQMLKKHLLLRNQNSLRFHLCLVPEAVGLGIPSNGPIQLIKFVSKDVQHSVHWRYGMIHTTSWAKYTAVYSADNNSRSLSKPSRYWEQNTLPSNSLRTALKSRSLFTKFKFTKCGCLNGHQPLVRSYFQAKDAASQQQSCPGLYQ